MNKETNQNVRGPVQSGGLRGGPVQIGGLR